MSDATAVPAPPPADSDGFLSRLGNLYFGPSDAFRSIAARPMAWQPLLAMIVLHLAFTALWMSKVDPPTFLRNQMEMSGQADKMSPDQLATAVQRGSAFIKPFAWATPVFLIIITIIIAAVFLLVFKLFMAGPVTFGQSWAIVLWTFLATSLVGSPLTMLVMALKGEWNLPPDQVLMANLGALLDRAEVAKPIYTLAQSLDLLSFWNLFLMSTGFAAATKKSFGTAAVGVVGTWAVFVLIKVGFAALRS
jgi:hypothetical protein